jgi:hypothetical protein
MADVAEVRVARQPWEAVFRTGTVSLVDANGRDVMVLAGVSDPDCFAGTIQDALTSGRTVAASLAHIAARRSAAEERATKAVRAGREWRRKRRGKEAGWLMVIRG